MIDIAKQYRENNKKYLETAKKWTDLYANSN